MGSSQAVRIAGKTNEGDQPETNVQSAPRNTHQGVSQTEFLHRIFPGAARAGEGSGQNGALMSQAATGQLWAMFMWTSSW